MALVVVAKHQQSQPGEGGGETLVPAQMLPEAVAEEDAAQDWACWLPVAGVQLTTNSVQGKFLRKFYQIKVHCERARSEW